MEPPGVILLGTDGVVLAANAKARAILAEGDGLTLDQNCLVALAGPCPEEGTVRVERPSGRAPYVLCVTRLENGSATPNYRAVTIYAPVARRAPDLAVLKSTFNLTRAELALAEQVVHGKQAKEAAAALGVSIYSVRTYLKRLYNKTGVRTQAKLVHKLLHVVPSPPDPAK